MKEYNDYLGIDISKETFDVVNQKGEHKQFDNTLSGFKDFRKTLPENSLSVMEVTGIYHLQLAHFLYKNNYPVAVVNPLSIKRFAQMHLKRNKTDKADALMISLFAQQQNPSTWSPPPKHLEQSKDIYQTMEQYISMRASLKNKLKEFKVSKAASFLIQSIQGQITQLTEEIDALEIKLMDNVKHFDPVLLSNIKSIAGIGKRTAALLIISTEGFKSFENAKQLSSYFGLAPTELSSGTSINGSNRISKMGNPLVRKTLYMCSLQASKTNRSCAELYQRLLAKGKPKKLALIAVSNKLLKIIFAIAKSGLPYDPEYKSVAVFETKKIVSV